jgi:hypothetical protein
MPFPPSLRHPLIWSFSTGPIELAYAVIAQGKILYERDRAERIEYEAMDEPLRRLSAVLGTAPGDPGGVGDERRVRRLV